MVDARRAADARRCHRLSLPLVRTRDTPSRTTRGIKSTRDGRDPREILEDDAVSINVSVAAGRDALPPAILRRGVRSVTPPKRPERDRRGPMRRGRPVS